MSGSCFHKEVSAPGLHQGSVSLLNGEAGRHGRGVGSRGREEVRGIAGGEKVGQGEEGECPQCQARMETDEKRVCLEELILILWMVDYISISIWFSFSMN